MKYQAFNNHKTFSKVVFIDGVPRVREIVLSPVISILNKLEHGSADVHEADQSQCFN